MAESHQGQVKYLTTVAMVHADDTSLEVAGISLLLTIEVAKAECL